MSGVHDGHRTRMREEFLKAGFTDATPEHKVLELLLFYSIPRRDTNEIAHRLIDAFGSLAGVMDASVEDLLKVPGISQNTACLIKLIMPMARQYTVSRSKNCVYVYTRDQAAEYVKQFYVGRTLETVFVLCLDNQGKVLDCAMVSEGDEISVRVSARTVLEQVFKTKATVVMLAHNHPRGLALPSQGDLDVTHSIAVALQNLKIQLLDHVIYVDDDHVSLAQTPEYSYLFGG